MQQRQQPPGLLFRQRTSNQNRIESFRSRTAGGHSIFAVQEPNGLIIERCQYFLIVQQLFAAIAEQQYRLASPEWFFSTSGHSGSRQCSAGQPDLETAALTRVAGYIDRAAVLLHDLADSGQPKPVTGRSGREERVE